MNQAIKVTTLYQVQWGITQELLAGAGSPRNEIECSLTVPNTNRKLSHMMHWPTMFLTEMMTSPTQQLNHWNVTQSWANSMLLNKPCDHWDDRCTCQWQSTSINGKWWVNNNESPDGVALLMVESMEIGQCSRWESNICLKELRWRNLANSGAVRMSLWHQSASRIESELKIWIHIWIHISEGVCWKCS